MTNPAEKKKKRSLRLWLWSLVIVGILFTAVLAWTPAMPSFQGKTVYDWMF